MNARSATQASVTRLRRGPRPATAADVRAMTLLRFEVGEERSDWIGPGCADDRHSFIELVQSADLSDDRWRDLDETAIIRAQDVIERLVQRVALRAWPYIVESAQQHLCWHGCSPPGDDGWPSERTGCWVDTRAPRDTGDLMLVGLRVPNGEVKVWRSRMRTWLQQAAAVDPTSPLAGWCS